MISTQLLSIMLILLIQSTIIVGRSSSSINSTPKNIETHRQYHHPKYEYYLSYTFEQFILENGKVYSSNEEYQYRKQLFQQNLQILLNHYSSSPSQKSYDLDTNMFMDYDLSKELPLGLSKSLRKQNPTDTIQATIVTPPTIKNNNNNFAHIDIPMVHLHHHYHHHDTTTSKTNKPQEKITATTTTAETITSMYQNLMKMTKIHDLPKEIDWRTKKVHANSSSYSPPVTTPVKSQGGCGSCWAFAAIAALESHIAIQTNTLFELSVQELVSCVSNPNHCGGSGGCYGSTPELAYNFVATNGGISTEWKFGYQSSKGQNISCPMVNTTASTTSSASTSTSTGLRGTIDDTITSSKTSAVTETTVSPLSSTRINLKPVASVIGFADLPSNNYDTLLTAVATFGPVVVQVAASSWHFYSNGVFDDSDQKNLTINHAVVLEGYGTDIETGYDYWLVRNSWGPLWGENGYIRLKRVDPHKRKRDKSVGTSNDLKDIPDPDNCKMDLKPDAGKACTKDDTGKDIIPQPMPVCGTSGILFDAVIPIGGHLV